MQPDAATAGAPRTAILAIHGVGDPKAGDTADAVARLLVARAGYRHEGQDGWAVPVEPVHPCSTQAPRAGLRGYGSPFVAARLGKARPADRDQSHDEGDLGIQLHYHLLRGTRLADREQVYEARRHKLVDPDGQRVDVLDLYWGDLSGLDSAVQRIVTELFTLVFHLSQLGRDAVQHTAVKLREPLSKFPWATPLLTRSQELADLLLTKPVGVLNALLVVLGLWWLPLSGLAALLPARSQAWPALAGGLLAAGAGVAWLAAAYRGWQVRALAAALAATGLLLAFALCWWRGPQTGWPAHVVAALWGLALAGVFVAFMRFCEPRVPGVRVWGLALGAALAVFLLAMAWSSRSEAGAPGLRGHEAPALWAVMALAATDGLLGVLKYLWAAMGLAILVLVLSGSWLRWHCRDEVLARGIDTGRFGLFASAAMFVTLACAGWSLAIGIVSRSLERYTDAQLLQEFFQTSTLVFAPVLLVLAVLLLGAVCVLAPSIVCEFVAPEAGRDGRRLGRWLTGAGTRFTRIAGRIVYLTALLLAVWVAFALGWSPLDLSGVRELSAQALSALSIALAGGAASLLVVGSRVFGSLGKIRIALDAALDVDRHFREFPSDATPRGRISARLYSLLMAVGQGGYQRIVIAAHSQGVVITTELLRYLQARRPELLAGLPPIHLFTCGGPLRQLYAPRFPALYPWVVEPLPDAQGSAGTTGPAAHALGVRRWTNAYCSGDYIGRWLWEPPQRDLLATGLNFEDAAAGVRQWCLGKGAHMHYYDLRMDRVAAELDALSRSD